MNRPGLVVPFVGAVARARQGVELQLAALDALLRPVTFCPIAQLLVNLHLSGILGEKFSPTSRPVTTEYRCGHCHSPRTRMKQLQAISDERLGPIVGFEMRCRCCGGKSGQLVPNAKEKAAA